MNWKSIIPWDWFKHEEAQKNTQNSIAVKHANELSESVIHQPIYHLHNEIDRLFNDFFQNVNFPSIHSKLLTGNNLFNDHFFKPNTNISTSGDNYLISVEAPGMDEKDLNIELKDNVLIIKGNKQEEKQEKETHYYRSERYYGTFQRLISLPEDARTEAIDANMKNGVLSITIPKEKGDESKIKQITINH
jgi:HSP20 family protein